MRKKIFVLLLTFFVLMFSLLLSTKSFGTSKYGSTGNEVKQIQTKLKNWGYYNGKIDGVFGSKTLSAVKKFQSKNGLKADGIVGAKTLAALGISGVSNTNTSSNNSNLYLISQVIYGEARGEPYEGQVAVGAVLLNRVADSRFPNSIAGVVYQSGAFTCVSDGQINLSPDATAKKAAQDAINGWDPTHGSIYYFNPNTATSSWIWSRPQTLRIGKHIFCK